MFYMNHIDGLIICSVYAINKKDKLDTKFNDLIVSYK